MTLTELRKQAAENPTGDAALELAIQLSHAESDRGEARELCFRALARDSKHARARLLLSKLFYLDRMYEFSLRELLELNRIHPTESLEKLIDSFGDFGKAYIAARQMNLATVDRPDATMTDDDVLGEIDLDEEFVDVLEEIEK